MHKLKLIILIFLTVSCSRNADWTAFVYPDIDEIPNADKVQNFTIGNYRTFEECQIAAIDRVRNNKSSTGKNGDYQCGYKCSIRDDIGGLLICKEIQK
jgi:hypothetical protein